MSKTAIINELASRRLAGERLPHNFTKKLCPGKAWGDKYGGFAYCLDCKNWAWALPINCRTKYAKELKRHVKTIEGQINDR